MIFSFVFPFLSVCSAPPLARTRHRGPWDFSIQTQSRTPHARKKAIAPGDTPRRGFITLGGGVLRSDRPSFVLLSVNRPRPRGLAPRAGSSARGRDGGPIRPVGLPRCPARQRPEPFQPLQRIPRQRARVRRDVPRDLPRGRAADALRHRRRVGAQVLREHVRQLRRDALPLRAPRPGGARGGALPDKEIVECGHGPFTKLEILALYVAALGHDAGHFGVNNAYLQNSRHALYKLYTESTLEHYHAQILAQTVTHPADGAASCVPEAGGARADSSGCWRKSCSRRT